jgi:phosphate starvation-inducible PhoH-like protein
MSRAKRAIRENPRKDRNNTRNNTRNNVVDFNPQQNSTRMKKIQIVPRTETQEDLLCELYDDNKHIVFVTGPAGVGKTVVVMSYALQQLQEKQVEKIILTRPAVSVEEEHGFLPGDLNQKMEPWMIPLMDVARMYYDQATIDHMLANKIIEYAPLAYMRGRSLSHAIIIGDEAQNMTIDQMKMLCTRIGEGSKLVIAGDLEQHDRNRSSNGLKDFIERLKRYKSEMISLIEFSPKDVQRHVVIEEILNLYAK